MNCPRDKNQLTPKQTNGIQYHVCEVCHGMLITKNDLDLFKLRKARLESPSTRKRHVFIVEGEAKSPLVDTKMEAINYRGIKIDVCRTTGHVWLDGGELNFITQGIRTIRPKKVRRDVSTPSSDSNIGATVIEGVLLILSGIIDI